MGDNEEIPERNVDEPAARAETPAAATSERTADDELAAGLEVALSAQAEQDDTGRQPPGESARTGDGEPAAEAGAEAPAAAEAAETPEVAEEPEPEPGTWEDLRTRYKAGKAEIRELQARIAELEAEARPGEKPAGVAAFEQLREQMAERQTAPARPAQPAGSAAAPGERYEPDFVFDVLARAESGELDASYKRAAEQYVASQMTPAELRGVLMKARQQGFGDSSPEIETLARDWLPVVLAGAAEREKAETQRVRAEQQRATSWDTVLSSYPELKTANSDVRKEYEAAAATLAEFTQQLNAELWQAPGAPQAIAQVMEWQRSASKAKYPCPRISRLSWS